MASSSYESGVSTKWEPEDKESRSSLEAAAEAAAKVNAILIAKGKLKPAQLSQGNNQKFKGAHSSSGGSVISEVDINDAPIACRNLLTRGSTQDEISRMSGAAVATRGRYIAPDDRAKNARDRPLYLCVQGATQGNVDAAVNRIREIINNSMPRTSIGGTSPGKFSMSSPPPSIMGPPPGMVSTAPLGSGIPPPPLMSLNTQPTLTASPPNVQERLFIGLEHAPPSFDVKSKIAGPYGLFLQHIQAETGAKVSLHGRASGCIEPYLGREAMEPMHVLLQHNCTSGLARAKDLAKNLVETVQQEYAQFQQNLATMPTAVLPEQQILALPQQNMPTSISVAVVSQPPPTTLMSVPPPVLAPISEPPPQLNPMLTRMPPPGMAPISAVELPRVVLDTSVPPPTYQGPPQQPPPSLVRPLNPEISHPVTVYTSQHVIGAQPAAVPLEAVNTAAPPPQIILEATQPPPPHAQIIAQPPPANMALPPPPVQHPAHPPGTIVGEPQPGEVVVLHQAHPPGAPPAQTVVLHPAGAPVASSVAAPLPQPAAQPVQPPPQWAPQPQEVPVGQPLPGGVTVSVGAPLAPPASMHAQIVPAPSALPGGYPPASMAPLTVVEQMQQPIMMSTSLAQAPICHAPPALAAPPTSVEHTIVSGGMELPIISHHSDTAPPTSTTVTTHYDAQQYYRQFAPQPSQAPQETQTTTSSAGHKRRFTEEKEDPKVPQNLLGYQHGPPHLANLTVSAPSDKDEGANQKSSQEDTGTATEPDRKRSKDDQQTANLVQNSEQDKKYDSLPKRYNHYGSRAPRLYKPKTETSQPESGPQQELQQPAYAAPQGPSAHEEQLQPPPYSYTPVSYESTAADPTAAPPSVVYAPPVSSAYNPYDSQYQHQPAQPQAPPAAPALQYYTHPQTEASGSTPVPQAGEHHYVPPPHSYPSQPPPSSVYWQGVSG